MAGTDSRRHGGYTTTLALMAGGVVLLHAMVAALVLLTAWRGDGIGDWSSFYAAGWMVRTGDGARLYDFGRQSAVQHALFGDAFQPDPYPLPAFVAIVLSPLTRLSFASSFLAWAAVNLAMVAGLAYACWRSLSGVPRRLRAVYTACAALSTPALYTVLLGQVDLFVLAGMAACYALLHRGRPYTAGAALALALAKPHLLGGVVLLLVMKRQWRTLATLVAVGTPLLLLPALIFGPGTLADQARLIASYPGPATDHGVAAPMMINVRGAIASLIGTSSPWLWAPPLALIAAASVYAAMRTWAARPLLHAQSWALAFALPLMYSPRLHMQSMVLLLAAGALFVGAGAATGRPIAVDTVLLAFCTVAGVWLLGMFGLALMCVPIAAAFWLLARRWPEPAAAAALPAPAPRQAA